MQPCTPQELEDAIATPPGNTDQLHAKTFSRLKQQRANKVAFARKILTWITYSGKTMSFSELRYVVGLDAEKPNLEHKNVLSVENLTELCVGFVVYYKSMDMFSLTHRTTWKYFQDNRMLHFPDAFDLLSRVSMAHLFAASTSASMRMLNHHLELGHLHTWSMHMARKLGSYVRRAKQIQLADGTESQTRWSGNTSLAWGSPASLHELVCTSLCNEPFREYALHALRCSSTYDIVHRRFYKSERQLENASTLPPKKGTPLHAAAQLGLADAVLEFASDAQLLNEPDPAGKTALSMVMEAGELDLAMSLADMGASVDLNSHAGRNVFLTSVGKGYNALNLRIIEAAKRRLPSTEEKLLFATYEGGTDDVRSAILELRDKRHRGEIMSAALLVAADCCHGALVEQLLYHIPDVNINYADWRGRTALHRAAERNDANTAGLLLTQGAMLEQRCKEGLTAWAEAIRCSGHGEVLHVLTNFRANVNATGNDGVSPLYIAAAGGHYEMVKRMLEFGTDPSIETSFSWTPIVS
jgi:ankyrin repeat protein